MSALKPRHGRRSVVAGLTLAIGTSLALIPAGAAHAATPLIVIGTSDVSDSNLVQNVIEPRFEAAYPQYDLQYVALGTGAAITSAKAGNGAALIVHAASQENAFVQGGFSLEPAGRAAFWGDYVLLGPASDPAGVAAADPHDIVGALEKVAAAGAAGTANFVTRGGAPPPGTATQEHALWALTNGVATCKVTGATQGGGERPAATDGSTCATPTDQSTADIKYPSWYQNGDSTSQAKNIGIADTCNFTGGNCYVFADRGTYAYLASTGAIHNLKIVTRDNAPTARGGREALINVFHAYGINPAAVPAGSKTDAVGAKLFLDFLQSTGTQAAIGAYLYGNNDPAFIPSAQPVVTAKFKKDTVTAGKKTVIKGNIANAVPGYPVLSGVTVSLQTAASSSPLALPKTVGTAVTDAAGNFTLKGKLKGGKNYRIGVGQITKVELPALSPQFSDILAPVSSQLGTIGGFKITRPHVAKGVVSLSGKLKPKTVDKKGKLTLLAAKGKGKLKKIAKLKLKKKASTFSIQHRLASGTWRLQLVYEDKGALVPSSSQVVTVRVP